MSDTQPLAPTWFDLSSPDPARARTFYHELFGWTMNPAPAEGYTLISGADGAPFAGIGNAGADSPYTGIVIYFQVEDLEAALERALKLGGSRRLDPVPVPMMGRMAVFSDPDGNPVGLLGA